MGDMTLNFSRQEFACSCGCGLDRIDPDLVANLQHSRVATAVPYKINSGCRCYSHNDKIGGKRFSAHLPKNDGLCHAVDIDCPDSHVMYQIVWDVIRRFRRVELGKKITKDGRIRMWIHVDNDRSLPQEVLIVEVKKEE